MKEIEDIVIGKNSIPALIITIILMILITVCAVIYWRIKHREETKFKYLLAGAAGFIVSARVLELGVHYFCIILDNPVSRFINGNTAAFVLYGVIMAGVFEECGRYIVLKYFMKKDRTRENAVFYGIGHGGIEVLLVILPGIISGLVVASIFSSMSTREAMTALQITKDNASIALPSIQAAASFGYGMMALNVIERVFAMLLHIGLTVIVYYGVVTSRIKYLPLAILMHMLMDTFAALYQRGILPLWSVEVWCGIWAIAAIYIAAKLYAKLKD
ncbi:YhfC family intramembrane metalloprotease [Butyrivibrio sp. MC2013]|uniref:YhfC family intramembrane metalloprotease n=1 Tax=Butyrivibrio sp. MC2013 TaxID=1280686 RepID=UPI000426A639|nr:YhfC family glutamic-type intramembrane protease [Butyrivibrio sp. MC2013]